MDAASSNPVVQIRQRLGWPQVAMAREMGMSLRAYQAIEAGESAVRQIHILAADRVSLKHAVLQGRPELTSGQIRAECLDMAAVIRGDRSIASTRAPDPA